MDQAAADMVLIAASDAEQPVSVASVEAAPLLAVDPGRFDRFFEALKAEVVVAAPDLSTEKGRKAVASAAFRVAKLKTAIDKAGKDLNAERRKEIEAVDAQRRVMWERLEKLQKEVRGPLDEWEAAEKERKERADGLMQMLRTATLLAANTPAAAIAQRIAWLEHVPLEHDLLRDQLPSARALRDEALPELQAALKAAEEAEALRAEVERLRAEAARREAEDQAAREAAERAAQPLQAAEEVETKPNEAPAPTPLPFVAPKAPQPDTSRLAQVRNALIREGEITGAQADLIVAAMVEGHIPHVRIAL